jgi:hypothetical protein
MWAVVYSTNVDVDLEGLNAPVIRMLRFASSPLALAVKSMDSCSKML